MGGKTQQASSQVTIPPEVLARYNSVNAQAQQTAATPFQQYSSDPNAFVSPMTTAQNMGLQQTANYANAAQPGLQQAMGMTAGASGQANPWELTGDKINQYTNPYTQNVTNQMGALMNQQANLSQSTQMGNAIKSGAFGGDRAGVAAANLQGQNALAYGNAMAPVLQQGYNTGLQTAIGQQGVDLGAQQANLQRMMTGANQYGQLAGAGQQAGLAGAQAMMGAGQVQQQTQQAGLTALYNQFQQQQSYPFQVNQFLANIAEGTGSLSGQTTNSTQQAPFFSDRRLKENIKRIGTAKNGLPIHSFNYKDDPEKLSRLGFMADEVEKKHPEAVGLAGGYKTVDHEQAMKSAGGSVTDFDQNAAYGRGGFDLGGATSTYDPSWQSVGQRHLAGLQSPQQGSSLYGSKRRHVPEASGGRYSLPNAPAVPGVKPTGLSQAIGTAQSAVGLGQTLGDAKDKYFSSKDTPPAATTNAPAAGGAPAVVAKAPGTPTDAADVTYLNRGGLADGGPPVPAVAAASMAGRPAEGVANVVEPTDAYKAGLGHAVEAQENANRIQDAARAEAATSPISFKPDWDYPGLGATDLQRSAKVYGAGTLNGYYDPTHGGSYLGFERGGYATDGAVGGNADVLKTPDPNATQDTTQMNIPDKQSTYKLPDPPKTGGAGGKSGAGQALGAAKSLMGLASLIPGVGAVTGPLGAVMGAGEALAGASGGLMVAGGRRRKGKRKGLAVGGQGEGVDYMSKTRQIDPEIADIADSWAPTSDPRTGADYMNESRQGRETEHQYSVNNDQAPLTTSANTGLAGQGVDYMSEARQGREPELRSSVHPAMTASNATPEEQTAYLKEHIPREDMHKVMSPAALAKAYPPTQETPAPGVLGPWSSRSASASVPNSGERLLNTQPSTREAQTGAAPVEGSGFDKPLNLGSAQLPTAAFPSGGATPEQAAAANALRRSPEAAALAGAEEARQGKVQDAVAMKRDYDARHAQSWGDSLTGVKPELAPETPEQEQARLSRYDSTTPATAEQATAGPMTQPGLRPSDVAALADKPAPAPGVAAAEAPAEHEAGLVLPPEARGAPPPGVTDARTFPRSATPLGGEAPAPVVKPAAPVAAPVPVPPRRPSPGVAPAAPAGAAARAPVDANGNPIEQFFSGLGRGVGDFFHGVGNIFTGGAQQAGNVVNAAGQTVNRAGQAVGQAVNSAGQAVSNEVHGRINELMTGSPKMAPPAANFRAQGVDQRLISNLTEATRGLPQGWHAQMESGYRDKDPRQHGRGAAVDVALYNEKGERLANYQDPTTFRAYEKFAQDFRAAQQHNNPELNDATRWGGYFSGKARVPGQKYDAEHPYGAVDLMHFDLGGRQGLGMLGGDWEHGMTAKQHALFPGAVSVGMGQRPEGGYPTEVATSSDGARTSATGQVSPGYHNGVQGILAQEESFRDKPYWDKSAGGGGAWAIGYGTHMVAGADGKMRPVQPGDTITPQGAHQNMVQRLQTEFLPRAVQKVGGLDTWRALPRNVRDGLGSTIWNYGNLPDRVAFVIRNGGGPAEIANAVLQLGGKTEAARERRAREAAHIRGGG
jgi:hypothetical protein